MTDDVKKDDRTVTTALPGGLYVMLGDNVYEDGSLKYEGKAGIKFGQGKRDWIRMSYNDFALLILWALEHKDYINSMVILERKRGVAPEL